MAESAENEPVYILLPLIENFEFSRGFVFGIGFRKVKTGYLTVSSSEGLISLI